MKSFLKTGNPLLWVFTVIIIAILLVFIYNKNVKNRVERRTDINKDGITNEYDQKLLAAQFGKSCNGCAEDINEDKKIDGTDLLLLLGNLKNQ